MSKIRPDSAPQNRPLSRRSALKIGAGAAAVSAIGFPAVLRAQSDVIRIGHLTPMTGFLGTLGEWAVMGIQMAAEEINAGGGVLGRPLLVTSEDSITPDPASPKAQRMLQRDGVEVLMGEISPASAPALTPGAARNTHRRTPG